MKVKLIAYIIFGLVVFAQSAVADDGLRRGGRRGGGHGPVVTPGIGFPGGGHHGQRGIDEKVAEDVEYALEDLYRQALYLQIRRIWVLNKLGELSYQSEKLVDCVDYGQRGCKILAEKIIQDFEALERSLNVVVMRNPSMGYYLRKAKMAITDLKFETNKRGPGGGGYGYITASPQRCLAVNRSGLCTTHLSWNTGLPGNAVVTVEIPGEHGLKIFACHQGNATAPWIARGKAYIFKVFATNHCNLGTVMRMRPVEQITVTGY